MVQAPSFQLDRRAFLGISGSCLAIGMIATGPRAVFGQTAAKLKIATIGAGHEGGSLGTLFAKEGHPVMFSSRNPDQLKDLVAGAGPTASAGTVADAVSFGDVILIAVPYKAMDQIGREYGQALAAKALILDISNPILRRDGEEFMQQIANEGGAGLATAKRLPGAHIVRCFNAIGATTLASLAHRTGDPVGVPIAGDDKAAVTLAETLIREIGFEPVLAGGLAMGKYLVPGTPLAGPHTPAELREALAKLT